MENIICINKGLPFQYVIQLPSEPITPLTTHDGLKRVWYSLFAQLLVKLSESVDLSSMHAFNHGASVRKPTWLFDFPLLSVRPFAHSREIGSARAEE